jgi:N-acetylglutamate synthase-like GNAT family acetyltransferase
MHPDHRKGLRGLRLIMAAEKEMERQGVRLMSLRTKFKSNHGLLFERIGFEPQDIVHTKLLGG